MIMGNIIRSMISSSLNSRGVAGWIGASKAATSGSSDFLGLPLLSSVY
jgi:hypothetical protein